MATDKIAAAIAFRQNIVKQNLGKTFTIAQVADLLQLQSKNAVTFHKCQNKFNGARGKIVFDSKVMDWVTNFRRNLVPAEKRTGKAKAEPQVIKGKAPEGRKAIMNFDAAKALLREQKRKAAEEFAQTKANHDSLMVELDAAIAALG